MIEKRNKNHATEKGFILVAVLFLISFLALAVSFFSVWVTGEIQVSKQLRKKSEALVEATSLKADLIFFLMTKGLNYKGLDLTDKPAPTIGIGPAQNQQEDDAPYISLFNKPYKKNNLIIRIQDEAGLINLGRFTKQQFDKLFESFEIEPTHFDSLYSKFKDYTKTERAITKALNGATIDDYKDAGKPEPTNEALRTPFEIKRVLEWDNHENFYKNDKLFNMITTVVQKPINLNSAQKEVLGFIPDLNEDAITQILEHRKGDNPYFKDINAVANTTGAPLKPSRVYSFFPGNTLRVTITSIESNVLNLQFSVTSMPRAKDIPWQINYQIEMPYEQLRLDDIDGDESEKEKLDKLTLFFDPKDIYSENK
jgi:hypothetical protein